MISVSDLPSQHSSIITSLGANNILAQRLMALGIMPSQSVSIEQRVPLAGPILCRFLHGKLGMRHSDASNVLVAQLSE